MHMTVIRTVHMSHTRNGMKGIDFSSFYDFSTWFWKSSDSVFFFLVFHFISNSLRMTFTPLASWIFLSFTSFWRNSDSYEYKNKSARRGAQFSGINHMWILKNSKDLLDNLKSRSFSQVSSIKTLDFSTLYTTLPHANKSARRGT
jgi:hypothetical protein